MPTANCQHDNTHIEKICDIPFVICSDCKEPVTHMQASITVAYDVARLHDVFGGSLAYRLDASMNAIYHQIKDMPFGPYVANASRGRLVLYDDDGRTIASFPLEQKK